MNMTPIAQSLAAQGRRGDSMLVHMTPNEVGGLQSLAQTMGGSLTTNPATGLPEANFLEAILPTILGIGITAATGGAAAPWMIGAGVGGGTALLTGDLQKGLLAGLGAFGGAGLGNTLMGLGAAAPAAAGTAAGISGTGQQAAMLAAQNAGMGAEGLAHLAGSAGNVAPSALSQMGSGVSQAFANPGAFGSSLVSNLGGPLGAGAAGLGMIGGFEATNQYDTVQPTTTTESTYEGPYTPPERQVSYPGESIRTSSPEFNYFTPSNPVPGYQKLAEGGMAEGFQTFGGDRATDNLYAFNPDSARFRNELEKVRILGRQTSAGIPLNVSGIDQQGAPIYENTYSFDPSEIATGVRDLLFKDMTDQDMEYLKGVLDIKPSPSTQVAPPTPSGPPVFTPKPTETAPAPVAPPPVAPPVSTAEKVDTRLQDEEAARKAREAEAAKAAEAARLAEEQRGRELIRGLLGGYDSLFDAMSGNRPSDYQAPQSGGFYVNYFDSPSAYIPTGWSGAFGQGAASGGYIRKAAGGLASLATGGEFLQDGSFVIDARTVAELGNGSSNAGMELLMQLGGRPVQGPGDGVSDSVPATIDGERAAAVARDEVIFDPEAVARIGNGDPEAGAKRLYALMRKAEQARKEVDRGEPSGMGLEALSMAGAV